MAKAPNPQFPDWNNERDGVYVRRLHPVMEITVVVSRLDGWNWGWIAVLDKAGRIFAGNMTSDLSLFDAIEVANAYIAKAVNGTTG